MSAKRCLEPNDTIKAIHKELGISPEWVKERNLEYYPEAKVSEMELVAIDCQGKPFVLAKSIAKRWLKLQADAKKEGVDLQPYSGFRSYLYQRVLIKGQLRQGRSLEDVLTSLAIPGCSEHHTGRAIDITEGESRPLGEDFEQTAAFGWLTENASKYGIVMSFPKDNPYGYIYEPWHWCFTE